MCCLAASMQDVLAPALSDERQPGRGWPFQKLGFSLGGSPQEGGGRADSVVRCATGPLPESWSNLTALTSLSIHDNNLTGARVLPRTHAL